MSTDASQTTKSILIVDDEHDIREILKAILTPGGYTITEAHDGQEALGLLLEKKFDLMILDLIMPGLSGEGVLQQLRVEGRLKDMSIIVLTVKEQRTEVRKGYGRGVAFWVLKPFSNNTIRELARYLLDDLTEREKEKILFKLVQ